MRRKLTTWESALKDAAKELGLPKDDFRVEKLATLVLLLKVQRSQWANGKLSKSSDMIEVMSEITKLRDAAGIDNTPHEVSVQFVEHYVGVATITCPHCKMSSRHEVSNKPFERATPSPAVKTLPEPPDANAGQAAPDPSPAEPKPATPEMEISYLENFSASAFHSQVINNRERAPLKRLEPNIYSIRRNTSPMSQ
jgi:hypothetical protein